MEATYLEKNDTRKNKAKRKRTEEEDSDEDDQIKEVCKKKSRWSK